MKTKPQTVLEQNWRDGRVRWRVRSLNPTAFGRVQEALTTAVLAPFKAAESNVAAFARTRVPPVSGERGQESVV